MSSLPQPPASPAGELTPGWPTPVRPLRRGHLTPAWRSVFVVGWVGVLLGFASVWRSARTLGLSTWWLGPAADPQSLPVQVLPLAVPVLLVLAASRNMRYLPAWGTLGALVLGAIALGDLGRFDRLAEVQLTMSAAALLISIASTAGMLRATSRPGR